MFPITALIVVFFLGLVSYVFKSFIDPDMGLFEKTRRNAVRSRIVNWGIIYMLVVTFWWYKEPIIRFVAEHRAEQFLEEHRPK
jgi:hypothetical protein